MKQEMIGWQWYQLDHMQIICTSLQTDNRASTSPLSFYRLDAFPAAQSTASKHWCTRCLLQTIMLVCLYVFYVRRLTYLHIMHLLPLVSWHRLLTDKAEI